MGCTHCSNIPTKSQNIIKDLKKSTQRDHNKKVETLIAALANEQHTDIKSLINQPIIPHQTFYLNLLAYSILLGRYKVYLLLLFKLKASLPIAEEQLHKYGYNPLSILCQQGYLDILKLYLPVHLESFKPDTPSKQFTLSLHSSGVNTSSIQNFSPIQLACYEGHLNVLSFIEEYFSVIGPPPSLDVHHIDERFGENCALISARTGNFVMMKYLFEVAKADFHIRNFSNEGALQVLAAASKASCGLRYLECVIYLVEVVGIDVKHMYEETLLLLECGIIVEYIEEKLRDEGICCKKKELERVNRVRRGKEEVEEEGKSVTGDTGEISEIVAGSFNSNFASFAQVHKIFC